MDNHCECGKKLICEGCNLDKGYCLCKNKISQFKIGDKVVFLQDYTTEATHCLAGEVWTVAEPLKNEMNNGHIAVVFGPSCVPILVPKDILLKLITRKEYKEAKKEADFKVGDYVRVIYQNSSDYQKCGKVIVCHSFYCDVEFNDFNPNRKTLYCGILGHHDAFANSSLEKVK